MPCCGKMRQQLPSGTRPQLGRVPIPASAVTPQRRAAIQTPMHFEYVGETGLTAIGPITGRRYRFGGPGARVAVDPRDAPLLRAVPRLRQVPSPES
jgi:hypothetical protein